MRLIAKLDELQNSHLRSYRKLPERRKQKVRELECALYQTQIQHFLEQFDIASAKIPLNQRQPQSDALFLRHRQAADVTTTALEAVPGFGSFLIMQLITWPQSLPRLSSTLARASTPPTFNVWTWKSPNGESRLKLFCSKAPSELNNLRQTIAARGRLQEQLEPALKDVAQAQADERAAA